MHGRRPEDYVTSLQAENEDLYDQSVSESKKYFGDFQSQEHGIDSLIVEDFDINQIHQQIKLLNSKYFDSQKSNPKSTIIETTDAGESSMIDDTPYSEDYESLEEIVEVLENNQSPDSCDREPEIDEDESFMQDNESDSGEESGKALNLKPIDIKKKSIVDDDFFSLQDMEKFTQLAEKRDMKDSNLSDDDYDDDENDIFSIGRDIATNNYELDILDGEDNANDLMYNQFFTLEPKSKKKDFDQTDDHSFDSGNEKLNENNQESGDSNEALDDQFQDLGQQSAEDMPMDENYSDEEIDLEKLSTFEKSQMKMGVQIKKLESENVAVKEWTLRGEVSSKSRPMNSLLEHDLDIDVAVRPAPIITEETTATLAEMIIQRIKDQAYDDVVFKAPVKDSVYDPNRRWELDDEKSKKSLAQIYEDEFTKTENTKTEKDVLLEKDHMEIDSLVGNLFHQLDSLTNFHYTPPNASLELQVIENKNAISMEEIIPHSISDSKLLVPREIFSVKVGKSQTELDRDDKRKLRIKAKRSIGVEKKRKEKFLASRSSKFESQVTKDAAMKKLMGQSNVTLVVDGRTKGIKGGKGTANVVHVGGKIESKGRTTRPEFLKL